MANTRLRIVLAEDAVLLREGLVELLERFGHEVVAAVGDSRDLITAVDEHLPDIVVTDVRMPPDFKDDGLRAAMDLRGRFPALAVLVLTQYATTAYACELLESGEHSRGGLGYLLKDRIGGVAEFLAAIDCVATGGTVIDPEVIHQLMGRRQVDEPLGRLTPREREVLGLMAEGKTNAAIAAALNVSQPTVAKGIGSIFLKFGLSEDDGHRRVLAVLTYLRS
ncbi:response regulator [Kitasatospora kifunensis]|uniref:DNA-binding NarL/FixJ family response regulator n=1 Tax=Kitasatospora kifunensis TaxID=58351 RepID=A0A7W7R655_KITKI|nr:response regulator transcription factor [Kitasatospora kifunensis]MBB4926122.1 DNA-binding NarL/FixJ family response regulator [Kitasatospora kifunensis]